MRFDKPPLTQEEQIDLLIQRGLIIENQDRARHYLSHLNYYRLGAYWLPFESHHSPHQFHSGTNFNDVINLYVFDREFRLLVMDAIERIEVSIRSTWAYEMSHRHGPHCHLDPNLFKSSWNYDKNYETLENTVTRSKENFIRHLRVQYDEKLPPIWALVEIMTFGQLSNWYTNTRYRQDRNAVASTYHLDEKILTSLMHHLTTVRNLCAHHSRLWNRDFTVIPKLPKTGISSFNSSETRKIYNTLTLMLYLMNQISPGHHWKERLIELLNAHNINISAMGFPNNWQEQQLWSN